MPEFGSIAGALRAVAVAGDAIRKWSPWGPVGIPRTEAEDVAAGQGQDEACAVAAGCSGHGRPARNIVYR